uniref:AAA+ ATPase domain-containing protein n=1 Tax=Fagus sylvatica TaxID=28930 RepID=A0A2N9F1X5_FAGSY
MADPLISVLLELLASITAQEAEQELWLVVGVDDEVRQLEGNLRIVNAVLKDAENRKATDEAVKLWLKKLEDTFYEMDDVLDEWNTAMIKFKIEKNEKENAEKDPIVKKIKNLNGKLDEIVRERRMYGFELNTRGNASKVVERPKTTYFVDVSEIYGLDKVKDDLVNILLGKGNEEERSPYVIALVGMGGIGKTTLAQLAYNDTKVQAHFDLKMWVCVSDPFDQSRVAKAIIQEALGGGHCTLIELEALLDEIHNLTKEKKFFLVLDDVWTEDSTLWERFRHALRNGVQGSRILVTTRKIRVAEIMGSTSASMINLEVLSEEDCWLVFSKIAFSNKDLEQCEQLETLGRQIAKKCKGLPLAAKTLGSLMRFKRRREQWETVLDSSLWELEEVEKELFAPLLLSYNDLPSPLKRCFKYCAFYPKDYVFSRDELVYMWMAQGYIDSKENIEIIARDYFENLAIRSFFQDFKKYKDDDRIQGCKMHDIVHDFAQLMTKNECFTINSDTKGLDYKNAHHLRLEIPKEAQFPESIYSAKILRTLILKELPDEVENFMHLRYLNLDDYDGDGLPETICNLFNLLILKINFRSPRVMKFPQGMGKLINLRLVILETNFGVNRYEFAREIGKLTSLRTLSYFNISGKDYSKGRNIGTLQISGLWNLVDLCEAENAQLKNKHLHTLKLYFDREYEERMENDALFLNAIESPPNLESLSIGKYWGTTMSLNWMMSLTKLKTLKLGCLEKLEHLPPLGKLVFLERMDWDGGMREEEEESSITIMPRLQIFENLEMPKLKVIIARLPLYNSIEEHGEEEFDKEENDEEKFDKEEDNEEEFDKEMKPGTLGESVDKVHPPRLSKSDPVTDPKIWGGTFCDEENFHTHGCKFEKGPQKKLLYHFTMAATKRETIPTLEGTSEDGERMFKEHLTIPTRIFELSKEVKLIKLGTARG